MDETSKKILTKIGITFETENQLNGMLIPREVFMSETIYNNMKTTIPELKTIFRPKINNDIKGNTIEDIDTDSEN